MAVSREQIRDLLGSGLSNDIVATTVGCDHSYISQLMSEPAFADAVIALRTQSLQANTKRDKSIDSIEDSLISKLEDAVDSSLIYKPGDILRAFAVVNAAKRRGVPAHESLVINQTIVNLSIPKEVVQQFTMTVDGEVVEVEGQTLVTMPAHELLQQLAESKGVGDSDNAARYKKVARYLPTAIEHGVVKAGS